MNDPSSLMSFSLSSQKRMFVIKYESEIYLFFDFGVFFHNHWQIAFLINIFSSFAQIQFLNKNIQGSGMAFSSSSRRLRICLLRSFFTSIRWLRAPFESTSRKLGGSPVEGGGIGAAADVEGYDNGGGGGKVVEFVTSA